MFPKRYWYVLLAYVAGALLLGGFIIPIILNLLTGVDVVRAAIYGQLVSFPISLIIIILLLKPDFKMEKELKTTSVGAIIGWSIAGFFMVYIGQIVAALIELHVLNIEPGSDNTAGITNIIKSIPVFFIIPAIVGPIMEELVFRKVIFGALHKKMNFFFAALLSSAVFSVFHMEFEHFLIYAAIGFIFSFLYVRTKRIIVPIIAHMTMNTLVLLIQVFVDIEELEKILEELENGFIYLLTLIS